MSPILSSQGMAFATAMAAVSGTLILLALKIQKPPTTTTSSSDSSSLNQSTNSLRPCISSGEKKKKNNNKKVRFAEDVVEPRGNSEEFRRRIQGMERWNRNSNSSSKSNPCSPSKKVGVKVTGTATGGMPANRIALYNGLLRDQVKIHRLACTY